MLRNYPLLDRYEKANFITHFLGLVVFIIVLPFLILVDLSDSLRSIGSIVFSIGLLAVYASSSAYHVALEGPIKLKLRKVDHMSIFLLIGGSYTAFILRFYATEEGFYFLALHWVLIAGGILSKIFLTGKLEIISTIFYVLLGWMVVFIYSPITAEMSTPTFSLLVAGGALYTLGVVFYVWHRLPFHHSIWHLFVFGGSFSHFLSLYLA